MLPSLQILPEITIKNKRQISHFCVLIEEKKNRHALCDRYDSSNKAFSSSLIQHVPFIWINIVKSSYLKGVLLVFGLFVWQYFLSQLYLKVQSNPIPNILGVYKSRHLSDYTDT